VVTPARNPVRQRYLEGSVLKSARKAASANQASTGTVLVSVCTKAGARKKRDVQGEKSSVPVVTAAWNPVKRHCLEVSAPRSARKAASANQASIGTVLASVFPKASVRIDVLRMTSD